VFAKVTLPPITPDPTPAMVEVGHWIRRNVPTNDYLGVWHDVSALDLYHASGRLLLIGKGGPIKETFESVHQDPSLLARFVVAGITNDPGLHGWSERFVAGRYHVLEAPR
jgi:hypothetical protein